MVFSNGARGPGEGLAIHPGVKVNVGLAKVNHALDIDGVAVFKGFHEGSNGARGPGSGLVLKENDKRGRLTLALCVTQSASVTVDRFVLCGAWRALVPVRRDELFTVPFRQVLER